MSSGLCTRETYSEKSESVPMPITNVLVLSCLRSICDSLFMPMPFGPGEFLPVVNRMMILGRFDRLPVPIRFAALSSTWSTLRFPPLI